MLNTDDQFNLLAHEFEALALQMRNCKSAKRRVALLQRMTILINEIDGHIYTSLDRGIKKLGSVCKDSRNAYPAPETTKQKVL
jgi:hypothetical protein